MAGVGVLTTLLLSGLLLASVVAASHQARSAADLGALAGAVSVQEGQSPAGACARASVTVVRNRAQLLSCVVDGHGAVVVTVATEVTVPQGISLSLGAPRGGPLMAKARARAGPSP